MPDRRAAPAAGMPQASTALLAVLTLGVGVLVANLYYAQPLIASIGAELHIAPDVAGSIVSVAQIGYGTGLFLLVPAADLFENKRLVLILMGLTVAGSRRCSSTRPCRSTRSSAAARCSGRRLRSADA